MMWLRYATASQEILLGPFVDDTDGKTAETGLTIANTDLKLWKEGGTSESNKNNGGATHVANGRYYTVLDDTDTNTLGKLEVNVHVSGALPVRREFMVLPTNVYDSLVLGTDKLDANSAELGGTSQTGNDIGAKIIGTLAAGTHNPQSGDAYAVVSNETYGNSAIETLVDDLESRLTSTRAGYLDKLQYLPSATAGSAGGVFIAGTNAPVTITGSGNALTLTSTGGDGHGMAVSGNGTGSGVEIVSGAGVSGKGLNITASAEAVNASGLNGLTITGTGGAAVGIVGVNAEAVSISSFGAVDSAFHITGGLEVEGPTILDNSAGPGLYVEGSTHGVHLKGGSGLTDYSIRTEGANGYDQLTGVALDIGTLDGKLDSTLGYVDCLPESWVTVPTAASVADAVWDESLSGHSNAGSAGLAMSTASSGGVDPSVLADAIWDEAMSGHSTAGSAGKVLTDVLEDTATTLPATLASIVTYVDCLPASWVTVPTAAQNATQVRSELATELARIDAAISSRGTGTALDAAGVRTAVGLASANLDAQITTLATAANLATLDTLVDRMAPLLVGTVSGAGSGTEVYTYGGVTVTITVTEAGNVSSVVFS